MVGCPGALVLLTGGRPCFHREIEHYGNLTLMQLASVTGMIGITFLMAWSASVVNWAWENRECSREILPKLAALGLVFAAVLLFGTLRLNLAPTGGTGRTIRVPGLLRGDWIA